MTKKFKKRSLSESNVTEKSENKDTNDVPVSPKKLKVEAVPNAQNNVASKKAKKGAQVDATTNKKKQEKNKNEDNVKKVTPPAIVEQTEKDKSDQKQSPQEEGLNRKERKKLQKAENNKLSKEKRKLFRREEGQVKTKTGQLTQEQIKEKIKELESRGELSKTAKKKLSALRKLLRVQEGSSDEPKNTEAEKTNNVDTSETTNSEAVAKKQNNKIDKKVKPNKTTNKATNENNANSKKQKNAKVQPGSLLRIKSKKDEDEDEDEVEDEDESNEEEETKTKPKSAKQINKKAVEEDDEDDDDDDDDDDEEENEDEEDDDEQEEDENEVEDEDEDEDEDMDDEEENKSKDANKKLKKKNEEKKKESNDATKKKGNETAGDKNQGLKKKRYIVHVSNIPYSITADQVRKHFLTKVSKVSDVRIPKAVGTDKPRGFCYVELQNQEDYEKALSLNHSFLEKRRINVQYSVGNKHTNAKQIIVAKNKKLDALRKEGKLAGSKKMTDKKVKKGKQNAVSSTA